MSFDCIKRSCSNDTRCSQNGAWDQRTPSNIFLLKNQRQFGPKFENRSHLQIFGLNMRKASFENSSSCAEKCFIRRALAMISAIWAQIDSNRLGAVFNTANHCTLMSVRLIFLIAAFCSLFSNRFFYFAKLVETGGDQCHCCPASNSAQSFEIKDNGFLHIQLTFLLWLFFEFPGFCLKTYSERVEWLSDSSKGAIELHF